MHAARSVRALVVASALAAATAAAADPVADFYKGQQVSIVVGHHPGTGFDVYSRVLARHMGRHLPGEPSFVVKNMAGASGIIAANWLYTTAPKDGATMGIFAHNVALENMFGNDQARFDASKFIWVGNMEKGVGLCGVTPKAGVAKFDDLREKKVIFGGTGATGPLVTLANATKNLLGAKIEVIAGYKGALDVKAAMQRGEVAGVCGLFWSHVISAWKDDLDSGAFKPILFVSGDKPAGMEHVAHVDDYAKTEEQKQTFGLAFNVAEFGRNYAMPPGVPADRVAAMRKAFMDTMKDPGFLSEAGKLGVEVSPTSGAEVEKAWRALTSAPKDVVERAKAALLTP
ncbi:MAG TPA: hypothetical protein VIL72_02010 [Beijerinckiaceae bacterium]|jgi:tripartite-type tricarboxylate transporter receptor subunit TctC